MLRLAILSSRGRLGTFTGALIGLTSAALATAWGMQLESVLRAHPPVERYAGATAVITGDQNAGTDHDVFLSERARVSSALTARLAAVPGVRAAIADVSAPARLGNRATTAHGWSSAALTPYVLSAGRPPAGPAEVATGYPAPLGARLRLASADAARTVTVVGVARPRHPVSQQTAIFLTDAEAERLAGHPGRVDAIGVISAPHFDVSRVQAAAGDAMVLTGNARGRGEYPELERIRTTMIPVTAAFAGLALFIAMFVVASTMGLSIQQREREIALLRAVAATPGQVRRMIGWEAAIVALVGSAAGIWPGVLLGRALGPALVRHGIVPTNATVHPDWMVAAGVIAAGVATTLLAVLAAGRRAARVPPTLALGDAAVEPRLLGPGRIVGGLLALAGAVPLFTVSTTTSTPETAAATSELTAICLVLAVGFLGPVVAHAAARLLGPPIAALSPVGGFLASANLGAATRRFSSASTPIVLSNRASLATASDAEREMNRWLGPLFVGMIFAFTSIAVVNTLVMIALRRGREIALLRLVGATPRQVRSMARWEAGLIIAIGLGVGLAIAATALLPLSHALTGSLRPYAPAAPLAAILGTSALLALLALALPTRRALRSRPVQAIAIGE